jgi:hypothetical protein
MSRGVLYIVWGARAEAVLERSLRSLAEVHPELPYEVKRLPNDLDQFQGLLEKAKMMDLSPYDETLYLDADTVVLDRLDFGFEQARRFALACCICECPWARRYRGLPKDDGIEYNTGVLFFTRDARPVFERWKTYAQSVDSSIAMVGEKGQPMLMPFNDQAGFAKAVREWERPPQILPLNWNFRPQWHWTFFGPVKIWHDYVDPPLGFRQLAEAYRNPNAVIQFHSRA